MRERRYPGVSSPSRCVSSFMIAMKGTVCRFRITFVKPRVLLVGRSLSGLPCKHTHAHTRRSAPLASESLRCNICICMSIERRVCSIPSLMMDWPFKEGQVSFGRTDGLVDVALLRVMGAVTMGAATSQGISMYLNVCGMCVRGSM